MPSFESPHANPSEDAAQRAAEAMLGVAEKMRRETPTLPDKTVSPFDQPYIAPIDLSPGEKSAPGTMPEALTNLGEEDIEGALGSMTAGDMEQKPVERTEKEIINERRGAAQHTEYAKLLESNMRLREITENEDEAIRNAYRTRLGLDVDKPIEKGQRFAFTPYEVNKLREMGEAVKSQREQPPAQQAA